MAPHRDFRVWGIRWCHYFVIQVNWIEATPTKVGYFHLFRLFWSFCDLAMTLLWPWGNPLSSPTPTHVTMCTWVGINHMYLKSWPLFQTWQSLRVIWSMSAIWERGDISVIWWGITLPEPVLTLYPLEVFWYISMLGSRWVSTTIHISSELNWSKTNKKGIFYLFEAD